MNFQVSRNGQMYGPYTLADLQRYVASGNVLLTDLAKSEEMPEWLPVSQVLSQHAPAAAGMPPAYAPVGQAAAAYGVPYAGMAVGASDPPNLSWVLVLIFSILTCGLFSFVWDLVQAAWMRRVLPGANALFLYVAAIVSELFNLTFSAGTLMALHGGYSGIYGSRGHSPIGSIFGLVYFVLLIAARFSMRSSLEDYYNRVDPIGLRLGPVMTFFFGNIYFQYHFNRIQGIKQAMRYRGQAI